MVLIDREELAWAAGFFDGEGSSGVTGRQVYLSVKQTHPEVLDRFAAAVGIGRVYGPYGSQQPNRRPSLVVIYRGYEAVQAVTAMLWFKLGSVKKAQTARALAAARVRRQRQKLTDAEVVEIVTSAETQVALAERLGVSQSLVSKIQSGERRAGVPRATRS